MRESQARWGRVAATVAALTVIATVASCSTAGDGVSVTTTETVTVSADSGAGSDSSGVTAAPGASDASGAPITVVGPNAGGSTGTGTASSEAPASETGHLPPADNPGDTQGIDDPFQTGTTASTPSTSAPVSASPEMRAAARMVAAQCPTVLSASDIASALGKSLSPSTIRVEDVANPDNKMTARSKCYYGTDDIGQTRPLVVAIAGFADVDAAVQQRDVTLASEKAAGAKVSNSDVGSGDGEIKIMLRDGGLAVTQVGAVTVSVAIDDGVIANSALRSALTLLTRAAINHVR